MLMNTGKTVRFAVAACIAASATATFAAEEVETLDEIVVTAQFRQQNLQDTPLAITAVTAELMEARSQTNISEITNQAPSVTLKQQSAMFGPAIAAYIRGVGAADFNPALEPGVGIYVDDVYIATLTGSLLDLLDLDRVEILRGPQGTLAGRNSIGGAVKLYSQKPSSENSGSFQATYGSRNRVDLRGTANFALGENLFMRISGVDKKQEGYVERRDYGCEFPNNPYGIVPQRSSSAGCVIGKDSNVNFSAVRGALRWLPTEGLEVNLSADYTNDRRNPTGVVLVDYRDATQAAAAIARIQPTLDANPANNIRPSIFVPPRGSYYNYASYYNPVHNGTGEVTNVMVESRANPSQFFEGWGSALDLDWKLSDSLSVKSISAWREYKSGFTNDNDLSPLASSIGDGTLPFHSFSQELRLNGVALDERAELHGRWLLPRPAVHLPVVAGPALHRSAAVPAERRGQREDQGRLRPGGLQGHRARGADRWHPLHRRAQGLQLRAPEPRRHRACRGRRFAERPAQRLRRQPHRLPPGGPVPLERRGDDLRAVGHGLQGRRRQPASLRRGPGRGFRSREAQLLGSGREGGSRSTAACA